jgi:hypothetical protein
MVPKHVSLGAGIFSFDIRPTSMNPKFAPKSLLSKISFGFNVGTIHRLLLLGFYVSLLYYDWSKFDPNEFGSAAVRGGGILSASSSWAGYGVENALIHE